MKKFIIILASLVSAVASAGVEAYTVRIGETNDIPFCCKVIGARAVTGQAAVTVGIKSLQPWTVYTNCTTVVTAVSTNFTVCASNIVTAATNLLPFADATWNQRAWLNEQILWISTNAVSTSVTNVSTGVQSKGESERTIATLTTSGHISSTNVTGAVFGFERLFCTGAAIGDVVQLMIER